MQLLLEISRLRKILPDGFQTAKVLGCRREAHSFWAGDADDASCSRGYRGHDDVHEDAVEVSRPRV
jgi:hypothetical protein